MRMSLLMLSISVLSGCAAISAGATRASDAQPLPGLAYPGVELGQAMPVPATVSNLLLSLPAHDVLASVALRQRYIQSVVLVQQIPGAAGGRDYLVADHEGATYGFWIRSFQGVRAGVTGYLVEVRGSCAELHAGDPTYGIPVAEAVRQCAVTGTGHFDSGLRAYRVIEGHPPEDVTESIAPDPAVFNKAMLEHYASLGASGVFALDENLHKLPIFRWVVEFDPENPSASTAPPIFDNGHFAHAGFVVWTGEHFERRTTVPRSLWPCRVARPFECPPQAGHEDQFVID
ncbi:hypothetical protein [Pseudoxanthomonas gei]|uniref:hypothetical protein n=1 Tax=Pseudoxanthomonas gei TaxID=1383030 RepID=UPI00139201E8|nr:hypothetical protein [Pseudoxanthomonas gei]